MSGVREFFTLDSPIRILEIEIYHFCKILINPAQIVPLNTLVIIVVLV